MDQKPVIQYVGQFYVYGSEAKVSKKKAEEKRTLLPKLRSAREHRVYVDPVAMGGIVLAVVLLAALIVGAFQLGACMKAYNAASDTLTEVKRENAKLEHAYRTGLNLESIRTRAEELGLVDESQLEKVQITVTVPEAKKEPSAWENFLWFLSGLLGDSEPAAE